MPIRQSVLFTAVLPLVTILCAPLLAQDSVEECKTPHVTFNHLETNDDQFYHVRLKPGKILQVCIYDTYPDGFSYSVEGIPLGEPADEFGAAGEISADDLSDVPISQVHDKKYGGYVIRIRANDPDDPPDVILQSGKRKKLDNVTLTIAVTSIGWRVGFAGGFTLSELTDPSFALHTMKNDAGVESKIVVREEDKEDDVNLGLGAFTHLFHEKQPWIALTFGLGIGEDSDTTYFVGPSYRFNDQGTVTIGYAWGDVDTLPSGQALDAPPIEDNVLSNLGSRTDGAVFFAITYTFLGGQARDSVEKPFKGANPK